MLDNTAFQCASVCLLDNCTVLNMNSVYSGNKVTSADAAAVYGIRWCNITNIDTKFNTNTGIIGIVMIRHFGYLLNNASTFR